MTLLGCCGGHLLLDLRRHRDESVLDVACALGRSLDEGDVQRVRKLLCGGSLDLPLVLKITLVADEQTVHVLACETLNLREPLLHAGKGLSVGDIVHDDDTVRSTVVAAGDSAEPLLTGSIPLLFINKHNNNTIINCATSPRGREREREKKTNDLKLDGLAVELDSADLKVDTDSRDVALSVGIIGETQKKAALTHTTVTDQKELEQIIAE